MACQPRTYPSRPLSDPRRTITLWAEQAVSDISVRLLQLVPLTRAQESVVHKCFSDIAVIQRGLSGRGQVEFDTRTLFDFERMIRNRDDYISDERREIQEVFDVVRGSFERPETVQGILDLEEALRTIIEYESTVMFEEVYLGKKQERDLPLNAPKGFDSIVGGQPTWDRIRHLVGQARADS